MRRKDREVTDITAIEDIIHRCYCCRLGFNAATGAYIVPLNFGWCKENGSYVFYFHGAQEGRKIDLIKSGGKVGFEMDCGYELHPSDNAWECTAAFSSIIGTGTATIVTDAAEKRLGLELIMQHNTGRSGWEIKGAMLQQVCVFKLVVDTLSCKVHL